MPIHETLKSRLFPFILTVLIILVDQFTKALVVALIPLNTVGFSFGDDFFRIIHARNPGIAFSIGGSSPASVRTVLFIVVPLVVISTIVVFLFRTRELTRLQRWALSGIVGGGLGNIIDRIFRPEGVVDFLDFRFFGIFGLDRWPTFNTADASVVVCGTLLFLALLIQKKVVT